MVSCLSTLIYLQEGRALTGGFRICSGLVWTCTVPNKGMNPAVVDLLAGEVQVLFASIPALQAEHADRVRVIAVAESRRSALMPALPTIAESGIPGFAVGNWAGPPRSCRNGRADRRHAARRGR